MPHTPLSAPKPSVSGWKVRHGVSIRVPTQPSSRTQSHSGSQHFLLHCHSLQESEHLGQQAGPRGDPTPLSPEAFSHRIFLHGVFSLSASASIILLQPGVQPGLRTPGHCSHVLSNLRRNYLRPGGGAKVFLTICSAQICKHEQDIHVFIIV